MKNGQLLKSLLFGGMLSCGLLLSGCGDKVETSTGLKIGKLEGDPVVVITKKYDIKDGKIFKREDFVWTMNFVLNMYSDTELYPYIEEMFGNIAQTLEKSKNKESFLIGDLMNIAEVFGDAYSSRETSSDDAIAINEIPEILVIWSPSFVKDNPFFRFTMDRVVSKEVEKDSKKTTEELKQSIYLAKFDRENSTKLVDLPYKGQFDVEVALKLSDKKEYIKEAIIEVYNNGNSDLKTKATTIVNDFIKAFNEDEAGESISKFLGVFSKKYNKQSKKPLSKEEKENYIKELILYS